MCTIIVRYQNFNGGSTSRGGQINNKNYPPLPIPLKYACMHTHIPTYSEFQESRCMVASSLSIDHLSEQKLLQRLAVGKDTGVLQLRSEGGNRTAFCHSNLEYYAK